MKKKTTKNKTRAPESGALVIFLTTFDSQEEAHKFAKTLVENGLAACINVLQNITSFYKWQDKVHQDLEYLALGKTTQKQFLKIKKMIKDLHPYTLPELISLPITDGHPAYLKWIRTSTKTSF